MMIARPTLPVLAALALAFATSTLRAAPEPAPQGPPEPPEPALTRHAMEQLGITCSACHTCETPSPQTACLRPCPRAETLKIAKEFSSMRGPSVVILDELEDRYLPVPFDHEGHANMAEMTRGCEVCHHYTPEGLQHPACKTCHPTGTEQVDIRMPGLKGAYHRQCMNCHREWSDDTRCGVCHHPKTGVALQTGAEVVPTKDDLIGRMHPPIPEPDVEIYDTKRAGYAPSRVIFRHKRHIDGYDLRCAECHHEDNCMRCHVKNGTHKQKIRTLDDHHQPCLRCHRDPACERCHFNEGEQPPPVFDHATTGWPLGKYHGNKNCRSCHAKVPFGKLNTECNACHQSWTQADFDHAVTGQILDDNHRRNDCEICHPGRHFERPPTCSECHDEEEGIAFPNRRPGPLVSPDPGHEPQPPASPDAETGAASSAAKPS